MKNIIDNSKCCGCHACMNICPKKAIKMVEDNKGFKYPVIDQKKCINCEMCKKVCPVLNGKIEEEKKIKAYACYNKNNIERLNSSSGGIFILLAKEIIKRNGIVFGASFDNNFNVVHTYAEKEDELTKFMGSKYTQSIIGNNYKKVKEFLEEDRYVLFSGTPCQIEGLKNFLKKDYDKLFTQDIVCHGVPSPNVWQKYLKYMKNKNNETIKSVNFRNKDHGWSKYQTKILFDTKIYNEEHPNNLYMKAFLNNLCLRDSCYNCSFKKKYRESDITLADYWGIDNLHPDINDDKGVSLVVVNTKKGSDLFNLIISKITYKDTDLDEAIKYNPSMINSSSHNKNEILFFDNLDQMEFDKLIDKYISKPSIYKRIVNKIQTTIKK